MATYVNNLRLKEIATGDEDGTWGTSTNTNLELIGEALGYNTQDCFTTDADATTTVADGATDPARAFYFKVTSSATLTATRTLTVAPNTVSRVMYIENATTGSQSINISQGSGANVTILTGETKVVYLDGAGTTAAVVDANAKLASTDDYLDVGNVTGTQAISFSNSVNEITLTGDTTLSFTGSVSGTPATTTLIVNQDGTGGHSITWPAAAKYAGGVEPPQTTGASDIDIWSIFTVDGGTTLFVSLGLKDAS